MILYLFNKNKNILSDDDYQDFVYEIIDKYLYDKRFKEIEYLLISDVSNLDLDTIIAILLLTSPYKNELYNRADFYNRTEEYLLETLPHEEVYHILNGLK